MRRILHKYSRIFLLSVACLCFLPGTSQIRVTASLDSASILMGRIDSLRLIVERDENRQGVFPILNQFKNTGIVTIFNDTVEIGVPRMDTLKREGGRITERLVMPVQVFDSGKYVLPPFVYITADDSVQSNSIELEVVPVKVGENDVISDYADVAEPSDKSFWDLVPDWLYDYWWLWLLILAAIAASVYFGRKYHRTGKFISLPEKPAPKPWTVALKRLESLKEKNLWENGMEKEYFTQLTDILRDYLSQRFGINAMEMTTRQILHTLADQKDIRDKRDYVRKILDIADYVKFAKVRPLPADSVAAYDNAVSFVKETIPETPEDNDQANSDNGEGQAKGENKTREAKGTENGKGGAK